MLEQRRWKRKIVLKDLLGEDDSSEAARSVAKAMSDRLKRLPDYEEGGIDDFSQAVEEMADIATSSDRDYPGSLTPARHFNMCLDAIYDWADAERVWID